METSPFRYEVCSPAEHRSIRKSMEKVARAAPKQHRTKGRTMKKSAPMFYQIIWLSNNTWLCGHRASRRVHGLPANFCLESHQSLVQSMLASCRRTLCKIECWKSGKGSISKTPNGPETLRMQVRGSAARYLLLDQGLGSTQIAWVGYLWRCHGARPQSK